MPTYANKNFRNIGTGGTNIYQRTSSGTSGGGGSGSGQVEVVSKKWSGQYDAVKMGGDPYVYGASHTVQFDSPTTALGSINSIRYDISVMAHKHIYGGVNSAQGWYRFDGTVPSVGGHAGHHDYEVPYVDTLFPGTNNSSHGNHGSGAVNNYNPYTGQTTSGLWYWESASSVGNDLDNGTIPIPDFPFVRSVTLTPSDHALGYYPGHPALNNFTLTVNSNGSVTILLDQSVGGYDGQTAALHGSIIYGF
tara:strand:- start:357 stop:1103 length:747 start_codon:yes stop_codon:yes gene_type:complete